MRVLLQKVVQSMCSDDVQNFNSNFSEKTEYPYLSTNIYLARNLHYKQVKS